MTIGEIQARLEELTRTVEKLEALTERVERLEQMTMNLDAIDTLTARVERLESTPARRATTADPALGDVATRRLRDQTPRPRRPKRTTSGDKGEPSAP